MDVKLTQKIRAFMSLPEPNDAQIVEGATMLLSLNRNRALHASILKRPQRFLPKLRHELGKFLKIREDGLTMQDVVKLERDVLPPIAAAIEDDKTEEDGAEPAANGKRADHDALPAAVKALWDNNKERWRRIKEHYNACLSLSEPCDRYEHVTALKEAWYAYKADMAQYDSYSVSDGNTTETEEPKEPTASELAKAILSARSYISKYLPKLAKLKEEGDDAAYMNLLVKVRERVALLLDNGEEIGDEIRARMKLAGISIEEPAETEAGDNEIADNEQG